MKDLEPVRYWPARQPGAPDLALFWNRRRFRRRLLRWGLPLVAFAVLVGAALAVVQGEPSLAFEALTPLVFPAAITIAIIYLARPNALSAGGVWEVDDAGLPVRFVSPKPPPELARDPGVTHLAYIQSIRARAGNRRKSDH